MYAKSAKETQYIRPELLNITTTDPIISNGTEIPQKCTSSLSIHLHSIYNTMMLPQGSSTEDSSPERNKMWAQTSLILFLKRGRCNFSFCLQYSPAKSRCREYIQHKCLCSPFSSVARCNTIEVCQGTTHESNRCISSPPCHQVLLAVASVRF